MAWLILLLLMLLVSAAPGISIYLESRQVSHPEPGEGIGDGPSIA